MQTFLPYPDFVQSARVLDRQRLGKQRVETKQIYLALTQPGYGWKSHPAVTIWSNHVGALAEYGVAICEEWRRRGYKDSLLPWFQERRESGASYPTLVGYEPFHLSHRSNLLRKDRAWYGPLFPGVPDDLPYVWIRA